MAELDKASAEASRPHPATHERSRPPLRLAIPSRIVAGPGCVDGRSTSFPAGLWRPLLALVLAATVVMGSPGPATISVTAVGAAFGLRHSLRYTSGIILGTIAVLLVVATGVMAVLASMPRLAPLLAVASAAYILYLAFKIATAPPLAARDGGASLPTLLGGFPAGCRQPESLCGDCRRVRRLLVRSWRRRAWPMAQTGGPGLDDRRHPRPVASRRGSVCALPAQAPRLADHQSDLRGDVGVDHGAGCVGGKVGPKIRLSFLRPRRVLPAASPPSAAWAAGWARGMPR